MTTATKATNLILAATATMLLAGCFDSTGPVVASHSGEYVRKHLIEGHIYYTYHKGGLLHSQSCTNSTCVPVTLEQLRNPHNFLVPAR